MIVFIQSIKKLKFDKRYLYKGFSLPNNCKDCAMLKTLHLYVYRIADVTKVLRSLF